MSMVCSKQLGHNHVLIEIRVYEFKQSGGRLKIRVPSSLISFFPPQSTSVFLYLISFLPLSFSPFPPFIPLSPFPFWGLTP